MLLILLHVMSFVFGAERSLPSDLYLGNIFVSERNLQGSHNGQNYQGCREGPEEKITMGHPKQCSAADERRARDVSAAARCPRPLLVES